MSATNKAGALRDVRFHHASYGEAVQAATLLVARGNLIAEAHTNVQHKLTFHAHRLWEALGVAGLPDGGQK